MHYHVTETKSPFGLYPGAAGVFTYYMVDKDLTLAVMFIHGRTSVLNPAVRRLYNVRVYPKVVNADQDLYDKMKKDEPYSANGEWQRMTELGSGFAGRGRMYTPKDTPTLQIDIETPPSKRTTE